MTNHPEAALRALAAKWNQDHGGDNHNSNYDTAYLHCADELAAILRQIEAAPNAREPYVTFTSAGVKVDLNRFLSTPEGKAILEKVGGPTAKCPDCGSPKRATPAAQPTSSLGSSQITKANT